MAAVRMHSTQNKLCCLIVLLVALASSHLAQSSQSRQQSSAQQQQQQQLENDQNTIQAAYTGGRSGEYSLIGDGIMAFPAPNGLNSKRARKMSAFMPMRGRKDGRDEPARFTYLDSNGQLHQQQFPLGSSDEADADTINIAPLRESEGEASILRLVAGHGQPIDDGLQASAMPISSDLATRLRWVGAPHQFANQFAIQHSIQQQQQQQPTGNTPRSYESVDILGPLSSDNGQVMQAKLRRAFHPMRGKKSVGSTADELVQLFDDM